MTMIVPVSVLLVTTQAAVAGPVWRFHATELPTLDIAGNIFTNPMDINDSGQVTGESGANMVSVGQHAFLWSPGEAMIDLDQGQWPWTSGKRLNESGTVAGNALFCPNNGACAAQPLLIEPDGTIVELEEPWVGYLVVTGINESKTIIFNRTTSPSTSSIAPRRWTPEHGTQWLQLPDAIYSGYAMDQNDGNLIVGYTSGPGGQLPRIWNDGIMSELQVELDGNGQALAVNNAGVVIGEASFNSVDHAARWNNAEAQPERLINDPVAVTSRATGLLEDGTIVGTWKNDENQLLAFRIAPDGTVDLYGPPPHPDGTLDVPPVAAMTNGWVLCNHMTTIYEISPLVRIPEEGWVFVNDRLVGEGNDVPDIAQDMNAMGCIITRGHSWSTPFYLRPMPPGDVDGDHVVGVNDVLGVLKSWGGVAPAARLLPGDVTADGEVDVNDLLGVIDNWQ